MKKMMICCMVFFSLILMTGCVRKDTYADDIKIYYVNKEITSTIPVSSGLQKEGENSELIGKILDTMCSDTGSMEYIQAVPVNVECTEYYIASDILTLVFNEEYYDMETLREILCRQALVATFVQLDGINAVRINVGDEALKDANGEVVGLMTADSFVVNPGKQINFINNATITLYFANAEGTGLAEEVQSVYYNSNIPLERLILEHLIAGPKTEGLCAALPQETGIEELTVADGVCYISFNSGFEKYNYNINESVVIYSIVDSLTELPYVDKVQISINGDSSRNYRDDVSLSSFFERDMTYLSPVKKSSDRESVIVNDVNE